MTTDTENQIPVPQGFSKPRPCAWCGILFRPIQDRRSVCSDSCRNRVAYARRTNRKLEPKPCAWCGEVFQPNRVDKGFCSHKCYQACRNNKRKKGKPGLIECVVCSLSFIPNDARHTCCSRRCSSKFTRQHRKVLYHKQCEYCKKEFGVKRREHSICCSRECGLKWNGRLPDPKREIREKQKKLIALLSRIYECRICGKKRIGRGLCSRDCALEEGRRISRARTQNIRRNGRECIRCHEKFIPIRKKERLCNSCRRREAKIHRLLQKYKEKDIKWVEFERINPTDIFERDNYRCQLCGRKVRMDVHYNHKLAPTLDHIIPKSIEPRHTRRNLRTTHRGCNSKRHVKISNEQLFLF